MRRFQSRRFFIGYNQGMKIILDAHQDLAYNMAALGRDYRRSAFQTRQLEQGKPFMAWTDESLLGWPEYMQARVALVFSTLFAAPARSVPPEKRDSQIYDTLEQAHQIYKNQLLSYHRLCEESPDQFRLILTQSDLKQHLETWQTIPEDETPQLPVGFIPLMEGAEGILSFDELPMWWDLGIRTIGLAWRSNRYTGGTGEPGPLTQDGESLLRAMSHQGFVLDISHMDPPAALQAIDQYDGKIIASHANLAWLVEGYEGNRLLTKDLLNALLERDAIIGVVPCNYFLKRNIPETGGKASVSLRLAAEQIDTICQIAGDSKHVGLGTDFDGGIGLESVPAEIETIGDLPKLDDFLKEMGYDENQREDIRYRNFLNMIQSVLPS